MELGKQDYSTIIQMPVDRMRKYLTWKINYDREIAKARSEKLGSIKL